MPAFVNGAVIRVADGLDEIFERHAFRAVNGLLPRLPAYPKKGFVPQDYTTHAEPGCRFSPFSGRNEGNRRHS